MKVFSCSLFLASLVAAKGVEKPLEDDVGNGEDGTDAAKKVEAPNVAAKSVGTTLEQCLPEAKLKVVLDEIKSLAGSEPKKLTHELLKGVIIRRHPKVKGGFRLYWTMPSPTRAASLRKSASAGNSPGYKFDGDCYFEEEPNLGDDLNAKDRNKVKTNIGKVLELNKDLKAKLTAPALVLFNKAATALNKYDPNLALKVLDELKKKPTVKKEIERDAGAIVAKLKILSIISVQKPPKVLGEGELVKLVPPPLRSHVRNLSVACQSEQHPARVIEVLEAISKDEVDEIVTKSPKLERLMARALSISQKGLRVAITVALNIEINVQGPFDSSELDDGVNSEQFNSNGQARSHFVRATLSAFFWAMSFAC